MKYQVKDPQGQMHIIEGPDGATPEQVIGQAKKLMPQKTDWKGVIGRSVKDVFQKPAAYAKDLGTNPVTMAQAIPPVMGMAGGLSPFPGGATAGTVIGRQLISNPALRLLGRKDLIPSGMAQAGEVGLSALSDVAAIPAMKKAYYGGKIGEAEKAAGVVTRAPTKAVTPGSVGETLNTLEAQIDAGLINTPQLAKDAKAVVSQVYKNPRIYEQTGEIAVQSQRVSSKVQNLLNTLIKGRKEPAQALAKAMTIPNIAGRAYKAIPWQAKLGMLGGGADAVVRKILGQ